MYVVANLMKANGDGEMEKKETGEGNGRRRRAKENQIGRLQGVEGGILGDKARDGVARTSCTRYCRSIHPYPSRPLTTIRVVRARAFARACVCASASACVRVRVQVCKCESVWDVLFKARESAHSVLETLPPVEGGHRGVGASQGVDVAEADAGERAMALAHDVGAQPTHRAAFPAA